MRASRHLTALVLASTLAAGCARVMPPSSSESPLAPMGPGGALTKALPEFKRRTLDGATFDTARTRGRVTVVKFFAKYCEPCKRSLPWLQRFAAEHRDVLVLGIAEDERESEVRDLVATFGLTFPIVHDTGNVLWGRFRASEMPLTFVADRHGRIRWVGGPAQTEGDLEAAVSASR